MRKHLNTVSEEDDKEEETGANKENLPTKDVSKRPQSYMKQLQLEIFQKNMEFV